MDAVLVLALAVFSAVAVSVAVCSIRPSWRGYITVSAPVVLGLASAAGGWYLLDRVGAFGPRTATGEDDAGPAAEAEAALRAWLMAGHWNSAWVSAAALAAAAGLAWLAFCAEGGVIRLARRLRRGPGGLPAELLSLNLPDRAETMRDVGRTAASPAGYWSLSVLAVVGEEFLFRVAMPVALVVAGLPAWVAAAVPAALYAMNHIGFGLGSVIGKFLFGLVLGAGAWAGGAVWVCLPVHLLYQFWVQRQFTRPNGRTRHRELAPGTR